MSTYIFGHTNPDSDSIVGAISLAYLKNQLGEDCVATRQGDISPETEFILNKFGVGAPELKTSYAGEKVYLVDFSDLAQAPKDIKEATILGIVDHHKLGDITTDTPLECWIRPIGCSNTVIKEMFDHYKIEIPKDIAGMMMCTILSDTVIFKSPTCTKADTKAVKELSEICGIVDYKALAMEMFIAKSAVEGASARNLNTRDYKAFDMNGTKVGVGQLEMVDISVLENRIDDLFADMKLMKEEDGLHTIVILLTDIMKEGSQLLALSDDISKVEAAFSVKLQNNQAWLDGVLSRKKQVIPFLQPQF
ncbi:MAG: manganese-dependent inorganic pyrophosphatase [Sulfurimonas sp.]|uniref:manganese-dependent inorganic pyrophosphatase n=1 Tax=Sulfurimonas sp. TaxID=2022749 RepID=UPI0026186BE0|nr:manganese-dependent inorganic pyrophosphatase [Sulfurimonas sp.]MDD5400071.1 manganese-dependent inorganic pyrophosphatase [Sulfurimonas sp.]